MQGSNRILLDKNDIIDKLVDHSSLFVNIGITYYYKGSYNKALECLKIFIPDHLDNFYSLYYLGLCCIANKKPEDALQYFQQSMGEINPQITEKRLDEMIRVSKEKD